MFCNFSQKFENSKWPPFLARQIFFENWHGHSEEIPCGSKISSKSLYLARFSRYKHFCVLQFCEKFENSKWPPFFARNFLFENWHGYSAEIPCGSKISLKSLYLAGFSRYKHFYVLQFLRKIQNGRHFWRDKIFLKIGMATLQIYPVGQKFRRNRSILQGFRDISIFMFCNFCEKFENLKWPPFLARQNFFQNLDNYSAEIPCGSKISSKSLYLARFSRYKHFCVLQFLQKFRKFKMAAIFGETKIF